MKLYVCWGTFAVPWPRQGASWYPSAHPCKRAHDALKEAGYSPGVVKSYGFSFLPDFTEGRKEAKRLTGESYVPVLVLDDGQVIADSENIVAWARDPRPPPPIHRDHCRFRGERQLCSAPEAGRHQQPPAP